MWNLTHFGNKYQCTGTINDALQAIPDVQVAVDNQVPYVNGVAAEHGTVPATGTNVTFRPRASGKA